MKVVFEEYKKTHYDNGGDSNLELITEKDSSDNPIEIKPEKVSDTQIKISIAYLKEIYTFYIVEDKNSLKKNTTNKPSKSSINVKDSKTTTINSSSSSISQPRIANSTPKCTTPYF